MSVRWKFLAVFWVLLMAAATGCNRAGDANSSKKTDAPIETAPILGGNQSPPAKTEPALPAPPAPKYPVVVIETSLGNITIRLDDGKAPTTVENFLGYVRDGFYNGTIIHQVHRGQSIMAGGYGTDMEEKPARAPIRNEAREDIKNLRGTIAMVRQPDVIDSAASQFFINVADNPSLDYKDRTPAGYGYCVFGQVTEGMDVVDRINKVAVHNTPELGRTPVEKILVKSIRLVR